MSVTSDKDYGSSDHGMAPQVSTPSVDEKEAGLSASGFPASIISPSTRRSMPRRSIFSISKLSVLSEESVHIGTHEQLEKQLNLLSEMKDENWALCTFEVLAENRSERGSSVSSSRNSGVIDRNPSDLDSTVMDDAGRILDDWASHNLCH